MGGQSNMHAKIDLGESIRNGVGAVTKLLRALRHGTGDLPRTHTVTEVAAVAQRGPEQRAPNYRRRPLAGHPQGQAGEPAPRVQPEQPAGPQIVKLTREQGLGR